MLLIKVIFLLVNMFWHIFGVFPFLLFIVFSQIKIFISKGVNIFVNV